MRTQAENLMTLVARRFFRTVISGTVLFALMIFGAATLAQQPTSQNPDVSGHTINAFQLSKLYDLRLNALLLTREGRLEQAAQQIRRMIDLYPSLPANHYYLATVLARQNNMDAAFDRLTIAFRHGFSNVDSLEADPAFDRIRQQDRFQSLIVSMRESPNKAQLPLPVSVAPAAVKDGIALVSEDNTQWDPKLRILRSAFLFGSKDTMPAEVQRGEGVAKQLNDW